MRRRRMAARRLAHKAEHAVDMESGAVVAVTLQGAYLGDTTTVHQILAEAGLAVAELVGREVELHPAEEPKVNVSGIEELFGVCLNNVTIRVLWFFVRTPICQDRRGAPIFWRTGASVLWRCWTVATRCAK